MRQRLVLLVGIMTLAAACANPSGASEDEQPRPCAEVQSDLDAAQADPNLENNDPDGQAARELVEALEAELASCDDGSTENPPETTVPEDEGAEPPPDDEDEAGVADSDGELRSLPLVDGGRVIRGDSTGDPRTPPTHTVDGHAPLVTWQDLVDQVGDSAWYVQAVNERESKTGFNWRNIRRYARTDGIDPRVIHVFNMDISDRRAREMVRDLVGEAADHLPIARHFCAANTRGFDRQVVQDFIDCRRMVRVSLAPIVYNGRGEPVGLRSDAGIFIDCLNIWWTPRQIVPNGPPPRRPPPDIPPVRIYQCPPDMPYGRWPVCKDSPGNDPAKQGNVPTQVQGQAPPVTGPATPPAAGRPPPVYVPPRPPPAQPPPRPNPPPPPPTTAPPPVTDPPVTGDPGGF